MSNYTVVSPEGVEYTFDDPMEFAVEHGIQSKYHFNEMCRGLPVKGGWNSGAYSGVKEGYRIYYRNVVKGWKIASE